MPKRKIIPKKEQRESTIERKLGLTILFALLILLWLLILFDPGEPWIDIAFILLILAIVIEIVLIARELKHRKRTSG